MRKYLESRARDYVDYQKHDPKGKVINWSLQK